MVIFPVNVHFVSLFSSVSTYGIPEEYQISGSHNKIFNNCCEKILDYFSKKWHPSSKRLEYLSLFAADNWKQLAIREKEKHTLVFCVACFNNHHQLQECIPGKSVYIPPEPIISLPDSCYTIAEEKKIGKEGVGRAKHSLGGKI